MNNKLAKKISKQIETIATEAGYQTVAYLGEWQGRSVYQPDFNDGQIHIIGLPQFIIEQDHRPPRWAAYEESQEIMEVLWPKETDEDE